MAYLHRYDTLHKKLRGGGNRLKGGGGGIPKIIFEYLNEAKL